MSTVPSAASDGARGLNISDSLRPYYVFPCAAVTNPPEKLLQYAKADHGKFTPDKPAAIIEGVSGFEWDVENLRFGTTWAATPRFIKDLPPSQVHVIIADQSEWPEECRSILDAPNSVHIHGSRSAALAVAAHLRVGLSHWSAGKEGFEQTYVDLPLGSAIFLREMKADPTALEFDISPNTSDAASCRFLTAAELADMWARDESEMPPSVPHTSLKLVRYLESDVTLVSVVGEDGQPELLAFKARRKPHTIYHELKILMHLPSLETIIPPPRYLVTIPSGSEKPPLVCGFLTKFIEGGSLNARLPELRREGLLTAARQLSLAIDVTSTLIQVSRSSASFYSDLRLDQIILSKDAAGNERAVFLDFEQSRNLYNWTAPEMYLMEWLAEMGSPLYFRIDDMPEEVEKKYGGILSRVLEARGQTLTSQPRRYNNPELGWYWPWLTSTAEERESAMVYMLGKMLWCIFEGRGDADIVLGRSSPEEADQRFPDFVRTHPQIRRLITKCTAGAREWINGPIKVYRRDGKVFPLGKTGLGGEPEATAEETLEAIKSFWQGEMDKAEAFAEARIRWDAGKPEEGDREMLHYLDRPKLHDVLAELEAFGARGKKTWPCLLV
ncbi:hypothetical protein F5X68DRAFT_244200 [Plectosphaerella plurivora]|uniref:Protein kinase domain-containing protein n=1 Tax=Plectosphaerella plurivora TaxID=936078 RepID=A0A9P8VKX6_9PEZI|nr:hypothetical protein F5X68DRAFT_244200 [Plectosphaerella plurivora]